MFQHLGRSEKSNTIMESGAPCPACVGARGGTGARHIEWATWAASQGGRFRFQDSKLGLPGCKLKKVGQAITLNPTPSNGHIMVQVGPATLVVNDRQARQRFHAFFPRVVSLCQLPDVVTRFLTLTVQDLRMCPLCREAENTTTWNSKVHTPTEVFTHGAHRYAALKDMLSTRPKVGLEEALYQHLRTHNYPVYKTETRTRYIPACAWAGLCRLRESATANDIITKSTLIDDSSPDLSFLTTLPSYSRSLTPFLIHPP